MIIKIVFLLQNKIDKHSTHSFINVRKSEIFILKFKKKESHKTYYVLK